ncbi:hypothetical protein FJQ98_16775 [Lysinibacillus agricola]|uniref:Uncharacterized protein n=1 Tax=Lysinibacillus agricola TaxID=2590012 RepID=A0ABX7AM29_9BACI|nr:MULTISPECIES: hypothetical protein [Lysinibacillus]KOS61422.1 hypothetical protein AN161_17655 [Lysinibacillus sp. FJAT-14222]QQP10899.1 hypothetical protein FJQ98_16775 [Lysinibacillus agricola]
MNEKEDEEMLGVLNEEKIEAKEVRLSIKNIELIKELASKQEPLIVENGIAQIDSSHPDYEFWMED